MLKPCAWAPASERFGLYSSQTMGDHLYVNGVERGNFRLHPLNTDDTAESWGCITFYRNSDFQIFRNARLRTRKVGVPGGRGLMAYGFAEVKGIPDFAKCDAK
ncbi:tlde1 domain-containing protein [Burkholderia latens]|uniref:tlde1 domain-containing protein n=1 Tax=Burkholderia latens TaxID=488446 RepID=UPI003C7E5BDC